jgi:Cu/Ag efflux pump CusA
MSEAPQNLGLGLLALVPIACCIGLPLIAAAGVSIAVASWAGGVALAGLVLIAAGVLFAVRVRSHRSDRPSTSIPRAR